MIQSQIHSKVWDLMITNIYWRMRVKQAFTTAWSAFTHKFLSEIGRIRGMIHARERENAEENVDLDDLV